MRRILGCAILLGAFLAAGSPVAASRSRSFLIEGWGTFREAEMEGVALLPDGTVRPGPVVRLLAGELDGQVWSLLRAKDGSIYAGSGSNGMVYRVREKGEAATGMETTESEVFAIAEGRNGEIYAAGAPTGTVVRIDEDGSTRIVYDTPDGIVWALLTDPAGNLYAGSGERGIVYRISPSGEAAVLHRAADKHVVSLAWSNDGKLLAGTEGRGLLLEIDPGTGTARPLYDPPESEVCRIVVTRDGKIYFATSERARMEGEPEPGSGRNGNGGSDGGNSRGNSGGSNGGSGPPGSLYLRATDGTVRSIWSPPAEESIHALALEPDGTILVGTGEEAALYRVTQEGEGTLLWKPEEGELLALLADGEAILAGTGNPGRIYRVGPERAREVAFRPEPVEAPGAATWGRAIWEVLPGSGRWVLRTRTGQTERPDSTWTGWSGELTDPSGSPIPSPPARFVQCEARFVGEGSAEPGRLQRIWIPYSEPNLPPRLKEIRLSPLSSSEGGGHEASTFSQDLGGGLRVQIQKASGSEEKTREEGPPPWVHAVRCVSWDAEDPDGDPLAFEVSLRQLGEERFRVLARDLSVSAYPIDTRTLPEGSYEVRIVATDSRRNPPGKGLRAERIAAPFRVDHRSPLVKDLKADRPEPRRLLVEGIARDETSPIREIQVSWDGRPWQPIQAADGVLDSVEERFRFSIDLEREEEGTWIAVRAVDAAGNEAIGRLWLR